MCKKCGWENKTRRDFSKKNRGHQFICGRSAGNLLKGRNQPLEKMTKEVDDKIFKAIEKPKDYLISGFKVPKEQFARLLARSSFTETVNIHHYYIIRNCGILSVCLSVCLKPRLDLSLLIE